MNEDLQAEMARVYKENLWGSDESRSGGGSTKVQTMYIEHEIPMLIDRLEIDSMLDIPCGDFNWMSRTLRNVKRPLRYYGADIVPDIVESHKQHESDSVSFACLDITSDDLPRVDLIFTRDCLVHLSDNMIFKAFENIKRSGIAYIAMTHFAWFHLPNNTLHDEDIVGGSWRKINFRAEPFNLPMPIDMIAEGSSEALGKDKTISVWRVTDLP